MHASGKNVSSLIDLSGENGDDDDSIDYKQVEKKKQIKKKKKTLKTLRLENFQKRNEKKSIGVWAQ